MATNLEQLLVRIDATTEGLRRELKAAENSIDGTARKVDGATKKINSQFEALGKNASRAFAGLAAAASLNQLVKVSASMQQLEARLKATTGSTQAATQALDFLRATANKQSIELQSLADGFNRLLPAVKAGRLSFDEMQRILVLANDNIKAFGLGSSEAQGLFLGLSQVLGSGTVTMEDLRQVTDRLPGSLDAIAAALGKDVSGLKEMVATGNFTTEMLKGPLLQAFKANEGAAESLANTYESAMIRMTNAFNEFGEAVADVGILDALAAIINELTNALRFLAVGLQLVKVGFDTIVGGGENAQKSIEGFNKALKNFNQDGAAPAVDELRKLEGISVAGAKATEKLTKEQEKAKKSLEKLIEKRKEYAGDLIVELARLRALEQESSRSIEAHDALKNAIDAETEAREKGFEVGTKEFEIVKAQILQREQLKDKIEANIEAHKKAADEAEEQQKRYAEALMKPFENAFENVQDELAKMLENGKFNFENLASIAKKMAAEVAAAWIIRPVLAGTLNAAGMGSITGAGGGGFGIGNISSIGSLFSGGGALNQPIFSSGSFIGGGIDSIGQAIGLGGSNFVGPMPAGQVAPLSSNFTPMAGIASIGGSIAANLLGVKGGTGTSVGGTIGGIAGTAIGGPIGGFIGSLAGSALGSLFNKKPSSKLQGGTIDLSGGGQTSTYGLTGKKFSQENADAASALLQVGQSIALAIGEISGKTIKESLRAEVGGRGVGYAFGDGETIGVATAGEALKGITQGIIDLTDKSAQGIQDLQLVLEKIDFKDAEQAMTELQFALNFSTLGDLPKQMSFVEQAVKEMNRQFDEAEAMAKKLGLSVERLAEMELKRLDAALGELSRGISRDLLAQVAPNELAVIDEQQRYMEQLKDLALLNAKASDYKVAEVLHQVRMKQLTEEVNGLQASALTFEQSRLEKASEIARRFDAVGGNFRKIIFDLQYGRFANVTPVENLSNMRSLVQQLGEQAAMGDADAAEQLSELLPAFLQLSGDVNGFNAQFAVDRNLALAVSKSALSTAERQVQLQSQIASAAQQQIQVLQSGFAQLAAALRNSGLSTQDVIDSATQSSGLLRAGETASILSQTGGSGISLAAERAIKSSLGFDFSTATGQFRDYAQASGQADAYRAAIRAAGGTPEFNTGGLVSGAGGVDKIHAKLTDGEFVMRAAAVRGIGAANLHAMNAKAGMPANNNGELAGRLDTLIKAVGQLAQVTAASGEVQSAQLSSVNRELASIRRDAGLAASA